MNQIHVLGRATWDALGLGFYYAMTPDHGKLEDPGRLLFLLMMPFHGIFVDNV